LDDATASTLLPRSSRRTLFQFSLRELLLLTAIAGLSLTVWRLSRSGVEPTPLMAACDVYDLVRQIRTSAKPGLADETKVWHVKSCLLGGAESGHVATKNTYYFRLDDVATSPAEIFAALPPRVKSLLDEVGCEVLDEGIYSLAELPGFYFHYRHGETQGVVNVDGATDEDELRIYVLIHEFHER